MLRIFTIVSGLLLFVLCFSFFTDPYPDNYFQSPIEGAIRLSGTFGELRSNHFHFGIDIKSRDGRSGQPIYACAEGYISRIKVQAAGYGNVIYIDHPKGYTTVYAHLSSFEPEVADYVKGRQYENKSFEIDIVPDKDMFPVEKGQEIGKMGTSGYSFGPHLHFEIRETRSEKPINPLLFGFDVLDKAAPTMNELKIYALNYKFEAFDTKQFGLTKAGRNYKLDRDTVYINSSRAGIGIKTYDFMTGVSNMNGVFEIFLLQDDSLTYQYQMEKFGFDEYRYINAHIDYEEKCTKGGNFNRCYVLPGNKLSAYKQLSDNGVVAVGKKKATKVEVRSGDIKGNSSKLVFWIKQKDVEVPTISNSYNYILPYQEANAIETNSLKLFFPEGSFYEDLYLSYRTSDDKSEDVFSKVHHIHNYKVPVHLYYDIAIAPERLPEEKRAKAFIAYCDNKNNMINCGGEWEDDGKLHAKVRDLGDYSIMIDDTPPTIKASRFSANMRGYSKMSFIIDDNLLVARNVAGLQYKATVDGKWILMEYDYKNKLLFHRFDGRVEPGKHQFRLEVTDALGNTSVFEKAFSI